MEIRSSSHLPSVKVPEPSAKPEETKPRSVDEPAVEQRLSSLETAVSSNQEAGQTVSQVAAAATDVARANSESASSAVRDIEAASELSQNLASRIVEQPEAAMHAQGNQQADNVRNLLA